MFSYKKNSLTPYLVKTILGDMIMIWNDANSDDDANTKGIIQINETKLPLGKSVSQSGDQNSSWIMNLEENYCRNHEYQDSNDR